MGNPVTYAEETLDVHGVYEAAKQALNSLTQAAESRARLLASVRVVRSRMVDREFEIATEAAGTYSELSETARAKVVKGLIHDDPKHRTLRQQEHGYQDELEAEDAAIAIQERAIKVYSARMEELGGLLRFYAIRKNGAAQ